MRDLVMGGRGQVGSALVQILIAAYDVKVLEVGEEAKAGPYDFLHVCIPYGIGFEEVVRKAADKYGAKWIINHSTVPVGTTRVLGDNAIHSPVRGQHDDLVSGLLNFRKYFGGVTTEGTAQAVLHFEGVGVDARPMGSPEQTELTKLLCLTRYMNDLAFYKRATRLYDKWGINRDALIEWTRSYNAGYQGTVHKRSDLSFPGDVLGGHCVGTVPKLLQRQVSEPWLDDLLKEFGQCEKS